MSKLRGNQVKLGSVSDSHLQQGSMTDVLRLLDASGSDVITRDANGDVSSIQTHLANGDTRTAAITRGGDGIVSSITVSFASNPLTKTYNITRDVDGNVSNVTES